MIHTRKKAVISNQKINSRVMNNFRRIYDFCMYEVTLELFRATIAAMETIIRALCIVEVHVKGKAVPLQAWAGPEDSRRLRLPDFKTIVT
jgi:hypothetical protein